jgi:hypothetical protein
MKLKTADAILFHTYFLSIADMGFLPLATQKTRFLKIGFFRGK